VVIKSIIYFKESWQSVEYDGLAKYVVCLKEFCHERLKQHYFSHHAKAYTGESAGTLLHELIWLIEIRYFLEYAASFIKMRTHLL
jgi:hypothetical protein